MARQTQTAPSTDADRYGDVDAIIFADGNADLHRDILADSDALTNPHANGTIDRDSDRHCHPDGDAEQHAHSNSDGKQHGDADGVTITDGNADLHRDVLADSDTLTNPHANGTIDRDGDRNCHNYPDGDAYPDGAYSNSDGKPRADAASGAIRGQRRRDNHGYAAGPDLGEEGPERWLKRRQHGIPVGGLLHRHLRALSGGRRRRGHV